MTVEAAEEPESRRKYRMNDVDTLVDIRPRHCLKWASSSPEWARSCDRAFVATFLLHRIAEFLESSPMAHFIKRIDLPDLVIHFHGGHCLMLCPANSNRAKRRRK